VVEGVSFKQTLIDRCGESGRMIATRDWASTSIGPLA
jgi:hypothetical protein